MKNVLLVIPVLLFSFAGAFGDTLTPGQIEALKKKLEDLEGGIEADKNAVLTRAVDAFRGGAADGREAMELYINCYKELNFTREGARAAEYLDWKANNKDRHNDKNFQMALRLQLQYLLLSMRAVEQTSEEDRAALVRDLESYLETVVTTATGIEEDIARDEAREERSSTGGRRTGSTRGGMDPRRMLSGSVLNTVFAEAYELDRSLRDAEEWEFSPLGLSGSYSKVILPYYAQIGPGEMGRAWDRWIEYETRIAKASKSEADFAEFLARSVPEMRWKKAVYFYQVGNQIEGSATMLALLEKHRGHPLLPAWLEEFQGLLNQMAAPPATEGTAAEE